MNNMWKRPDMTESDSVASESFIPSKFYSVNKKMPLYPSTLYRYKLYQTWFDPSKQGIRK